MGSHCSKQLPTISSEPILYALLIVPDAVSLCTLVIGLPVVVVGIFVLVRVTCDRSDHIEQVTHFFYHDVFAFGYDIC